MCDSRVAEVGKQGKDVSKNCVQVDIPEHSVAGIYIIVRHCLGGFYVI